MSLAALPEELDALEEPVYGPYVYARSLLTPESRVLDVGCGNGKVAAYLAETGATVDGIEPAATRADAAAARVRYLSLVPVGEDDPRLLPEYDVITFFDVVEHLVDPDAALRWAVEHLAAGGRIVASVPNSAHISFRKKMLRGDWTMSDWGLFDRTHLRFYDLETMRALQPAGTQLEATEVFAPDVRGGWRLWRMRRWPTLFALHGVLVWKAAPDR